MRADAANSLALPSKSQLKNDSTWMSYTVSQLDQLAGRCDKAGDTTTKTKNAGPKTRHYNFPIVRRSMRFLCFGPWKIVFTVMAGGTPLTSYAPPRGGPSLG